ncbi:hypothetical protein [Streptomyces sp. NPDC086989]|uniref:hypothetical protein n=1 Tax=Streptomyces sp. NPDC086989 TaxID=3365764 RepID=UPI00382FA53F
MGGQAHRGGPTGVVTAVLDACEPLYGRFELDVNSRLDLDPTAMARTVPGPRSPQGEITAAPA